MYVSTLLLRSKNQKHIDSCIPHTEFPMSVESYIWLAYTKVWLDRVLSCSSTWEQESYQLDYKLVST